MESAMPLSQRLREDANLADSVSFPYLTLVASDKGERWYGFGDRLRERANLAAKLETGLAVWRRACQIIVQKHYPDAQIETQYELLSQARQELTEEAVNETTPD